MKLAVIQQQSVLNEECDISGGGVKTYSNPPTYFQGVRTPNLRIYTPVIYLGSWIAWCVLRATAKHGHNYVIADAGRL